jgi:TRAP-type C4-dicarboxylate transport system permease small subunit
VSRQPFEAASDGRQPAGAERASLAADGLAARVGEVSRQLELEDPDRGLPLADCIVNRAVELVGVSLLAGILAIIFVNAVTRYALNYSFIWAEEVVIGLVPWLAVSGLFLSVRRRQMIRIEFFLDKFPPAGRRLLATLADLLGAVMLAWLAWLGFRYVAIFGGDPTPYLGLPKGLFTSALWLGPAVVALAFAVAAWRERRGRS